MNSQNYEFPAVETALVSPNGLLAVGGDLSPERLIAAYSQGIFPWFNEGEEIMWWSPDPRAVLFLDQLKISRSLTKVLRKGLFKLSFDRDFPAVIQQCAELRASTGTWITADMIEAYCELHRRGIAHSVEVWQQNELVGGLYGLKIDKIFCGESMFSKVSNASKVGLIYLVNKLKQQDCILIDCQIPNPHLLSLGATTIARHEFLNLLRLGLKS